MVRSRKQSRRGVSLVEVLVVLVILVLGILSIARLFPGGFFALRSAENATFADRLAQAQLESLRQNDTFLLDAVYMYANGAFLANVGPDDLSGTTANPYTPTGGTADVTLNDINKARFIQNETFSVPSANTGPNNNGVSIHALNYGPIVLPSASYPALPTFQGAAGATPSIQGLPPVHSAPWKPVLGNSQQAVPGEPTGTYNVPGGYETPQDLLAAQTAQQPSYAVDYTGQRIAVTSQPYAQEFTLALKITFTPNPSATPPPSVTTATTVMYYFPVSVPANNAGGNAYTGTWFDPVDPNNGVAAIGTPVVVGTPPQATPPVGNAQYIATWNPNTAILYRTVDPETPGGSLSATLINLKADPDPYKYVVLNPDATLTNVNLGVFAFNPRIAGQQLAVSYLAYNWHIIHEDVDVPTTASTPIRLTLNHILRVNDVQSDQTVYGGMFQTADTSNTGGTNYDIVLLDTDTGDTQGLNVSPDTNNLVFDLDNAAAGSSATQDQVAVSYQGGRITLPTNTSNPWYYGNHKHIRVYYEGDLGWGVALQKAPSLYAPGTDGSLSVGQYAVSTASPLHLHFPNCDLGKIVEIDSISYIDKTGNQQQVSGASGTIGSDAINGDSDYVDLTPFLPNVDPTKAVQVGAVRGISARAVVIWKERTTWKTRALDTVLTRAQ